ncbi:MAG: biotin--[acetyl-CoA-carboxylase] ligase [Burkholderiales bacterium]|jgi:BirA family biotin operon repressor/biotin-[acetyl-CoA-carboxylase] ligase|nr:biotin--[acetyl-CoA-carboxylase] ligase [Burkholderiales bacterium]
MAFKTLRALSDGAFHSGEDIARALGVTRGAVWYGIRDLAGCGFSIEKVRGRGYRLSPALSLLDAVTVSEWLGPAAATFAIEVLDSIDSTNTRLLQRAAAGAPSGLVLAAEAQTAGRGRRGRPWRSAVGSTLTFSLLWRFARGARELAGLSLAVGLALARTLRAAGAPGVALKWPNDVMLPAGKLAGILIEMQGDVLGPSAAVIGIGVNVRADPRVAEQVDQPLADLESATAEPVDRNRLLAQMLAELGGVLESFAQGGFAPLRAEWQQLHAHQDRRVRLLLPDGGTLAGIARGVADDGVLLLETADGLQRFHSGELSLRAEAAA